MEKTTTIRESTNAARHSVFFQPAVQPKLAINQPGDMYEQQADAVADMIMRMPVRNMTQSTFFRPSAPVINRKCKECEEDEKKMQRKSMNEKITDPNDIENYVGSLDNGGQPLSPEVRNFFEPRFGHDFGGVKIHTDHVAAKSAQSINALAYTSGSNIVFNSSQYAPDTHGGKALLAHELTHVVQQGNGLGRKVQRTSFLPQVNTALGMGPLFNFDSAYLILSPLNETDMLDTLLDLHNQSSSLFHLLIANVGTAKGPIGITRLLAYFLGVKNALTPNDMTTAELLQLPLHVSFLPFAQQQAIQKFIISHRPSPANDLYKGTHLPTAVEQGNVEKVFNPGATVTAPLVPMGPVTITLPSPDPVCSNTANFEKKIRTAIEPTITSEAVAFRTRKAAGPNFNIASAKTMADLAQAEVENYFRPYLAGASRSGAAGTYTLGGSTHASALLADQSTTKRWQTTGGRLSWLRYWYDHMTGKMNDILHCDDTQINSALTNMATDAKLIPDIDDYINSWPAEATGGINIQPFLDATRLVCQRWDTFTTIIHEFIHILAHPNFRNVENALPNNATEILKEGLDDVLRKELWEGPGKLRANLISPARNTDRAIVEGVSNKLDTSKVCSHPYYDNLPAAESVTKTVGSENVKIAYFLGQTEFLGIGKGTSTRTGGSLATTSFYDSALVTEQDLIPIIAGETRDQLLLRTNGTEVRDSGNNIIAVATPLPASVRIPGVRKVFVHTDDTVNSIAAQNGITPYDLMSANGMFAPILAGRKQVIIPRH